MAAAFDVMRRMRTTPKWDLGEPCTDEFNVRSRRTAASAYRPNKLLCDLAAVCGVGQHVAVATRRCASRLLRRLRPRRRRSGANERDARCRSSAPGQAVHCKTQLKLEAKFTSPLPL